MRRTTMRTAAVLLTAALTVTCLCGCGKGGSGGIGNSGNTAKGTGLDVSLDHSYSGERFTIDGMENPENGLCFGDQVMMLSWDKDYEKQSIFLYNPTEGSTVSRPLAYPETLEDGGRAYANSMFVDNSGNLNILFNAFTWTKNEAGEDEEYVDLGMTLEIYDKELNVVETRSLGDVLPENSGFSTVVPTPQGGFLGCMWDDATSCQVVNIYDKDFNQTGKLNGNFQYVESLYTTTGGDIYICYDAGSENGMTSFGIVDPVSGNITPVELTGRPAWTRGSFSSADGKYDLYIYDSENIYGVNIKEGKCEPVLNWINSDFQGDEVDRVLQLSDGRFMLSSAVYNRDEYSGTEMWLLSPRPADAFKNTAMISMAGVYVPNDITRAVLDFNRTHDDVRIALVNYEKYNTEDEENGALKKLQTDMTSGVVADLILTAGLPYESFANKGLFLDLTDRVDSSLNSADYFSNVFDALRYDGKLYHVGASFSVETLVGKEELVGSKSGISFAEFMQLLKDLPAGTEPFSEMTRESAGWSIIGMNMDNFVNVGAGSCTFNTPEFVQLLELCSTFPSEEEMNRKMENADQKYWEDRQYQYINNKTAFESAWMNDVRSVYEDQMTQFDKAKVTRVGFPISGSGGNGGRFNMYGTVAISANSAYKEQCWEFISSMFTDEAQENLSWAFPVSRKVFDKMAEDAQKPRTYKDENGKEVEQPFTVWRGEEEIKFPYMTKAYADELRTYIEGVRDTADYDVTIMNIIDEEAKKFYAGDQTAQQAADMIQSRASLYLSEQA